MICEHGLVEFCTCIPRRPPVYVAEHAALRGPGERLPPWQCQCVDPFTERRLRKGKRHADAIACQPQNEVDFFKAKHGIASDGKARALLFIESFAPLHDDATGEGAE